MNYEQKFERFRKLGGQLGLMIPKTTFTIKVENPDGSVIEHKSISRSWTRNAYNWMLTQLGGVSASSAAQWGNTYLSFKDTTPSIRSGSEATIYTPGSGSYGYQAIAGNDDWGIVCGTGVIAEEFDDYALGTKIVHGNDPTELSYNACGYTKAWDGGTLEMQNTFERIFNNNSGGQIDIGEIGIYAALAIYYTPGLPHSRVMVIRDLVSPVVEVVDTAQMTVTYDIILTYPE